jgi:hypothetical protein
LVRVSRWVTVVLAALSLAAAMSLESVSAAWKLLVATGAGAGTVLIARWFWWRVNAWSEITAMTAAALISIALQLIWGLDRGDAGDFATLMLITVPLTTAAWVAVTLATPPEPRPALLEFYRRVRPHSAWWGPIAREAGDAWPAQSIGRDALSWAAICGLIYGLLFGFGKLLLLEPLAGLALLLAALACAAALRRTLAGYKPNEGTAVFSGTAKRSSMDPSAQNIRMARTTSFWVQPCQRSRPTEIEVTPPSQ